MCSASQVEISISHKIKKITNANRTLNMIEQTLHAAPEKAKFLAYTYRLCQPLLEYADTL